MYLGVSELDFLAVDFGYPASAIIWLAVVTMKLSSSLLPVAVWLSTAVGASSESGAGPVLEERVAHVKVDAPAGSILGKSSHGVETFAGVPYAEWPVGDLRLRPPTRRKSKLENWDATGISPTCPQQYSSPTAIDMLETIVGKLLSLPFLVPVDGKEECLTVTVSRPAGVKAGDKLPVLFWIYGGGFTIGSTNTYDPTDLMKFSQSNDQPIVYVGVNYRLNGFGFLPGKEVREANITNLGLRDQRMGLEWVADNIEAFGGDPDKVTIWGESAGSISVFNHMLYKGGDAKYKGKPLFRGAIMNSGTSVPALDIDSSKAQAVFDTVVGSAGCLDAEDSLECLRKLPFEQYYRAASAVPSLLSYEGVPLSYLPRPDGDILPESPDLMMKAGKGYFVPSIIGDQEDEGTLFCLQNTNITNTPELVDYLRTFYFSNATEDLITDLVNMYPNATSAGSPFRTKKFNEWSPGYKRRAAILGDVAFTLARRSMLNFWTAKMPQIPVWSYLASYKHDTPILGTFHATDIIQIFYGIKPNNAAASCRTYYLNFVYNLDPNKGKGGYANWPLWKDNKILMWFKSASENDKVKDDFRKDRGDFFFKNIASFRS